MTEQKVSEKESRVLNLRITSNYYAHQAVEVNVGGHLGESLLDFVEN